MKRFKNLIIVVLILLAFVLVKLLFLTPPKETGAWGAAQGAAKPASPITAYVVIPEVLDNVVSASGTIAANEEAELKSEVAGKIVFMKITEGTKVSKGELLLKINDADLQAQLKKLKLQSTLAEEKEQRQKKLLDINGISKEEYDIALNQVQLIKADIENLEAQIAKTEIRAPFNGVLGIKKVSEGTYLTPATNVISIQQTDPIKIDFSISEKYSTRIKRGDKINFSVQGTEGAFEGTVYAIEPKIDLATRTIQIRAIAPNRDGKLFPGAFAQIKLPLNSNKEALMLPTESIIPVLKGQKVYVIKSGVAYEQIVETGVRTSAKIEITKGIQRGDTVAVNGVMSLRNETPVKITNLK